MRTDDATTRMASVCSSTRIPSPTLSIPVEHLKTPQYGLSRFLATLRGRNAQCCVFTRRETYASSAMGTGWYKHSPQGNRESSRRRTAYRCAHCHKCMGTEPVSCTIIEGSFKSLTQNDEIPPSADFEKQRIPIAYCCRRVLRSNRPCAASTPAVATVDGVLLQACPAKQS